MPRRITIPYSGSNCRMAPKLVDLMPREGRTYAEWFVGRGNVLWAVLQRLFAGQLRYENIWINDLNSIPWFRALETHGHLLEIPPRLLNREDKYFREQEYHRFREEFKNGCPYAILLEPYLTFKGGGFKNGGPESNRKAISQRGYGLNIRLAQNLLLRAKPFLKIDEGCWTKLDYSALGWDDFVYFGVPYHKTDTRAYNTAEMNYDRLIDMLVDAPFKWILEEYPVSMYIERLGDPESIHGLQCAASGRRGDRRTEYVWRNYDSAGNRLALPRQNPNVYANFSIRTAEAPASGDHNANTHELDAARDSNCRERLFRSVEGGTERQANESPESLQQAGVPAFPP